MVFSDIRNPFGTEIRYKNITDSTMNDARQILKSKSAQNAARSDIIGMCMVAGHQTAGRGRFENRPWLGVDSKSLLCTIILPPESVLPLSLILARALCVFLRAKNMQASIKWPNDILVDDNKIAGILVLIEQNFALCGIGLNVHAAPNATTAWKRSPTCMANYGYTGTIADSLLEVLFFIKESLLLANPILVQEISACLWNAGQAISIEQSDGTIVHGIVEGIGNDGCLLLSSLGKTIKVYSGE